VSNSSKDPLEHIYGWRWLDQLEGARSRLIASEDSSRTRLAILAPLLLGLSLVALQISNPRGLWLIIVAWAALGFATVFTAFREVIETRWVRDSFNSMLDRMSDAMEKHKAGEDPMSAEEPTVKNRAKHKLLFNVTALAALLVGVVFLLAFAVCNLLMSEPAPLNTPDLAWAWAATGLYAHWIDF